MVQLHKVYLIMSQETPCQNSLLAPTISSCFPTAVKISAATQHRRLVQKYQSSAPQMGTTQVSAYLWTFFTFSMIQSRNHQCVKPNSTAVYLTHHSPPSLQLLCNIFKILPLDNRLAHQQGKSGGTYSQKLKK